MIIFSDNELVLKQWEWYKGIAYAIFLNYDSDYHHARHSSTNTSSKTESLHGRKQE